MIGSGNLAWHLAPALDNAGYSVREVYSPNPKHARELVGRLYQAELKTSLDFSNSASEIFIVAASDDAIEGIAQEMALPGEVILAHTSGSLPLGALGYAATPNTGVFYPLQTFTRSKKVSFEQIPVFVEAETGEAENVLLKMARAISTKVKKISSAERRALHVAAVFASNFTNQMLVIAKEVMEQNRLDFEWLKPLVVETITKSLELDPEVAQTGPARRGDVQILDRHMQLLQNDPELSEIYRLLSQRILDRYNS